jgi:uncharacterized protein (TIGR00304 family)
MESIKTGILLIIIGFFATLIGSLSGSSSEVGGVLLIGPIPIIFGSSPIVALGVALAGLIMMVLYLFLVRQRT